MKNKFLKILSAFILFCIVYVSVIFFFQDKFLFEPNTNYKSPQEADAALFKENPILTEDGIQIMTWYYEGEQNKPLILFFHGNTGQIARFAPAIKTIANNGYSIAMIEYRGFGNTKGKISQETGFSDAVLFYDYYRNLTQNKIIFYGYSFGCAFAMGLTQYRNPDGIILTAPFSSLYQEVKDYPVPFAHLFLKDKYPSDEYIKNINCPVLIIHGNKDKLIDFSHSKKLFNLAPVKEKEVVILDNVNHNNIFFKEINNPIILKWLENNFYTD